LTSEQMRKYHADHYRGGNITLVVAGNCDWEQIETLADQFCAQWPAGSLDRPTHEAEVGPGIEVIQRDTSIQQTVLELHPAPPAQSEMRFAAQILSTIVGDDGGSRIYWELVDPGLVESADLGYLDWDGSGAYLTYLGCEPETTKENLARIHAIYDEVNADGVTEVELEQAKNKIASRIVLRSEKPMGRLASLGNNWVYRNEYQSVADDLATLKGITLANIRETLDAYPLGGCTTVCVGPLSEFSKT
jgi:predicted Zn-dependent peptidase